MLTREFFEQELKYLGAQESAMYNHGDYVMGEYYHNERIDLIKNALKNKLISAIRADRLIYSFIA